MSAIIDAGENLMLDRQASVAQTKTQGGRRLAQKRGPTLYNLEVEVPAQKMNSDRYYSIENEVITLEYGANDFESANITGKIGGSFTTPRGAWSGTPLVKLGSQTGTSINIDGATVSITNWARAFDYVQFKGSTKVYQVAEDAASDSSGNVTLKLNSPLVVSPLNNSTVTFGDNVSFNFAMMDRPATSYQPGNIVIYGTFKFEEVIRDVNRGE